MIGDNPLVIFEPSPTGHRMVFVGWLLDQFRAQGFSSVTVLTGEGALKHSMVATLTARHAGWATFSSFQDDEYRSPIFSTLHSSAEYQYRMFSVLTDWLQSRSDKTHVIVPYLEATMLIPLALSGRGPANRTWSGILASTRCHYQQVGIDVPPRRIKDWLERRLISRLLRNKDVDRVFSVDPYLSTVLVHDRLVPIRDASPDFQHSDLDIRKEFGIPPKELILLLYGHIDDRKALDVACEALADPRTPQDIHLLVVGTQVQSAKKILQQSSAQKLRSSGRLHELERFVTESEEISVFMAADIAWVYYPKNFWNSGVMVRAGKAGKPIISTAKGMIGRIVRDQNLGLSVFEENIDGVVAAITKLATDATLREKLGQAGAEYYQNDTPQNFALPIVESVKRHFALEGN